MIGENEERWRKLCEAAVKEQNSERLLDLCPADQSKVG